MGEKLGGARNVGQGCEWKDYKAVNLHGLAVAAYFQDNQALLTWVHQQELSEIVTCLGDGHDGIWNLIAGIATHDSRLEILDWYHLVENLYKVGGDKDLLVRVEAFLWRGNVAAAIAEFDEWSHPQVENFIAYLHKHQSRIPDYWYFQTEQISSIGSGAIESTVKQISRRVKISGAQWHKQNVPQVLSHRTAYLILMECYLQLAIYKSEMLPSSCPFIYTLSVMHGNKPQR